MASQQKETGDLSIPGLVRQLADETTTLVRQELELARAEAARAGEAVVTLAKQELLAAGALTAFLILVLDEAMTPWLAALLVGLAYAVVAGALFFMGRERVREAGPFVPEQTIETVKEDIEWAKTQVGSESK